MEQNNKAPPRINNTQGYLIVAVTQKIMTLQQTRLDLQAHQYSIIELPIHIKLSCFSTFNYKT